MYTISWSQVNGADSYQVKESDDNGNSWHEIGGTADVWTDVGNVLALDFGTTTSKPFGVYKYKIRAVYDSATTPRYSGERVGDNDIMVGYISVPQVSSTGNYMIFWPTINGASTYDLYESSIQGSWPATPTFSGMTANYKQITGKTSGTWYYRVQPDNWVSSNKWMYGLNGCVIGAPAAPATLTLPSQSHTGQYNVSWSSSLGATNYELQEFTSAGIASPYRIYYGPNTSFTVTGKTSGTYYYRVRAENGAGFGGWNFSTNGCAIVPPPPPAILTVDPVSRDGTINTSWPVVDGATAYELQEDRSSTFDDAPVSVFNGNGTSHMVLGKTSGTYYFRVRSINGAGAGAWRTAPNGCQIAPPYAPTTFVVPANSSTGSFLLDWDAMDGALHYDVEEDTDSAFTAPTLVYSGPVSAFSHRGVPDGTYYFRVRAGNGAGISAWTDGANSCVVTRAMPVAPGALTVPISSSSGNYSINWGSSADATHYEIQEALSIDFGGATLIASTAATTLYITGRGDGNFYYRVRAVSPVGRSAWTAGLNPCVVWITTMHPFRMEAGHGNPGSTTELPGAQKIVMLHIRFTAGAKENIQPVNLTVETSGSGDDSLEITDTAIWRDLNGNGVLETGEPRVNPASTLFAVDDGTVDFDLSAEPVVAAGTEAFYLVTASFAAGTVSGGTFTYNVPSPFNIQAVLEGTAVPADIPSTDPDVQGGTKTVSSLGAGSLCIFPGPNHGASAGVNTPTEQVPMLQFSLAPSSMEGVELKEVRLSVTGMTGAPPMTVRLYEDLDEDGRHSLGDTEMGTMQTVPSNGEFVVFSGLTLTVPAQGAKTLLVTGNFSGVEGAFSLSIGTGADVIAVGTNSKTGIEAEGAPIYGTAVSTSVPAQPGDSGGCGGGIGTPGAWVAWLLLLVAFVSSTKLVRTRVGNIRFRS